MYTCTQKFTYTYSCIHTYTCTCTQCICTVYSCIHTYTCTCTQHICTVYVVKTFSPALCEKLLLFFLKMDKAEGKRSALYIHVYTQCTCVYVIYTCCMKSQPCKDIHRLTNNACTRTLAHSPHLSCFFLALSTHCQREKEREREREREREEERERLLGDSVQRFSPYMDARAPTMSS